MKKEYVLNYSKPDVLNYIDLLQIEKPNIYNTMVDKIADGDNQNSSLLMFSKLFSFWAISKKL